MCVLSCRASWSSGSTRYYSYGRGGGHHTWQEWVRQWLFRQPSWAIFLWIMLSTALPLQLLLRISQLEANLCIPASAVYGLASIYAGQLLCQRSNCCRSRMCIRWYIPMPAIFALFYLFFIPVLSTCRSYFTSRTPDRPEDTTLLLFSCSSPMARRHPWAPWWTVLCMLFASARKSASCKKWHVLVRFD